MAATVERMSFDRCVVLHGFRTQTRRKTRSSDGATRVGSCLCSESHVRRTTGRDDTDQSRVCRSLSKCKFNPNRRTAHVIGESMRYHSPLRGRTCIPRIPDVTPAIGIRSLRFDTPRSCRGNPIDFRRARRRGNGGACGRTDRGPETVRTGAARAVSDFDGSVSLRRLAVVNLC